MALNGPITTVADWPETTIADITTKVGSGATSRGGSKTYLGARIEYALVRSQNVFDRHFDRDGLAYITNEQAEGLRGVMLQRGDILLNITGDGVTFGRACIVPEDVRPACVNQHVSIIRVDPTKANAEYVLSFLTHPDVKPYIESFNAGGSRRAITKGHIESFQLPLPLLHIQCAIGRILNTFDDKIESNCRYIQLSLDLLDVISFRAGSDVPYVPLGELVEVSHESVDPSAFGSNLVDHFSLPAFDDGARPERVEASSIMSNKLLVSQQSILLSRLNPRFNRTWWVAPYNGVAALASTEFALLTAVSLEDLAGIWLAVRDEYFRCELVRRATGTSGSHQRVRPDDLLSIDVPDMRLLPREVLMQALALLKVAAQRRDEIARLERTRNVLLPELLSGRIRVPEASETVEEAVV